jgi:hypothetical protein
MVKILGIIDRFGGLGGNKIFINQIKDWYSYPRGFPTSGELRNPHVRFGIIKKHCFKFENPTLFEKCAKIQQNNSGESVGDKDIYIFMKDNLVLLDIRGDSIVDVKPIIVSSLPIHQGRIRYDVRDYYKLLNTSNAKIEGEVGVVGREPITPSSLGNGELK